MWIKGLAPDSAFTVRGQTLFLGGGLVEVVIAGALGGGSLVG